MSECAKVTTIFRLIVNKIDLLNEENINDNEKAEKYAIEHNMLLFKTSAKTGINIDDIFQQVCTCIVKRIWKNYKATFDSGYHNKIDNHNNVLKK